MADRLLRVLPGGLEREKDRPCFARGPGRSLRSSGPVLEAYADADLSRRCRNCGAAPMSFCNHPNGTPRKIPCMQRMVAP